MSSLKEQRERLLQAKMREMANIGAVSYTHLDVYKRQDISVIKAGLMGLQRCDLRGSSKLITKNCGCTL